MARVLVVEDHEVNRQLMEYLLAAHGHAVTVAADGVEGLAALRAQRPDAVVCDIEMPRLDGVAFAQAVRADPAFAGLPLLAVTSYAMHGDRSRVLAAGFDDYVAKPIDPEHFVPWLEAHLRGQAPAAPASAPMPLPPPRPPREHGPLVLVVDDEPLNLELKRSCLEPLGYRVRTAAGPDEALRLAQHEVPALFLSDVGMPQGDGFDFIVRVKRDPRLAGVPFVFISTTHWDESLRTKALALGAVRYLRRPMDAEDLIAEVQRWVQA